MKRPDPLTGSGRFLMGSFMFVEINQALEKIRNVGWISRSEWPDSAGIRPSEADLSESEGRLLRTVPADELDLVTLQNLAQTAGFELGIEHFPVIDSTNRQLMERVRDDRAGTTLMVCDYQYAGRGRRGRHWISPYARSLAFSYAHSSSKALHELGGLSCVVGLAVLDVLGDLGVEDGRLKWPNDVWIEASKLAGILVELANHGSSTVAVIGVGLNVALTPEERAGVDQPIIDLRSRGVILDRNRLLMLFVRKIVGYLEHFEQSGFAAFRSAFDAVHLLHQRDVVVHPASVSATTPKRGRVVGVGNRGQLRIETAKGVEDLLGGEVSLRPAENSA